MIYNRGYSRYNIKAPQGVEEQGKGAVRNATVAPPAKAPETFMEVESG